MTSDAFGSRYTSRSLTTPASRRDCAAEAGSQPDSAARATVGATSFSTSVGTRFPSGSSASSAPPYSRSSAYHAMPSRGGAGPSPPPGMNGGDHERSSSRANGANTVGAACDIHASLYVLGNRRFQSSALIFTGAIEAYSLPASRITHDAASPQSVHPFSNKRTSSASSTSSVSPGVKTRRRGARAAPPRAPRAGARRAAPASRPNSSSSGAFPPSENRAASARSPAACASAAASSLAAPRASAACAASAAASASALSSAASVAAAEAEAAALASWSRCACVSSSAMMGSLSWRHWHKSRK